MPGAIASIFIITLLIAYSVVRANVLFNKLNPQISKSSSQYNLNEEDEYRPQELGFDFAFGLDQPIDEKYASYSVYMVHYYYTDEPGSNGRNVRIKEKIPLPIIQCGNEYFDYYD